MKIKSLTLPALLAIGLLAACGREADDSGDERSATGEVLEGTISDAMLPVDKLRSQPPLIVDVEEEPGDSTDASAEAGDSEEEAPDAEAPEEPETPAEPETFQDAFGAPDN